MSATFVIDTNKFYSGRAHLLHERALVGDKDHSMPASSKGYDQVDGVDLAATDGQSSGKKK
jgi:hypothetical protein